MIDIRKMAIKVNDRLKLLIIEEDDSDIATDIADEVQVNLLSGSPAKRSPGGCKVETPPPERNPESPPTQVPPEQKEGTIVDF